MTEDTAKEDTATADSAPASAPAKQKLPAWIDFGPLLLFFASFLYWKRDNPDEALIWAAAVLAVAATIMLLVGWVRYKRVSALLVFSTVVIGGSALIAWLTGDKRFIYQKPTFLNALYGVVILGGVVFRKNALKLLMGEAVEMPDAAWRTLAVRWALFFFAMAILNEFIWRSFSETFWASFKVFGFMPLTLVFTLAQIPFLQKHGTFKS